MTTEATPTPAVFGMGDPRRLDSLDDLLRRARAADGNNRIYLRDPIAAFGAQAVVQLATWLTDPRLGPFAVRTMEHAATSPEAATLARRVLTEALRSSVEPVRGDIVDALQRLRPLNTGIKTSRPSVHAISSRLDRRATSGRQVVPLPGASLEYAYRVLEGLVEEWRSEGEPAHKGIEWPRSDWLAAFPAHEDLLRRLPRLLARASVRDVCADASRDGAAAEGAFLAVMVWGFGRVGYGRHRVQEILAGTPRPAERLVAVARTLAARGVLAAYRRLGDDGDCRLKGLGPAFGTKYLYFCQPAGAEPAALIHDANVVKWFMRHAEVDLSCDLWSESTYRDYLDQMRDWAVGLRCRPDDLELRIFEATVQGQWAKA
jgi:hypothetical protein